MFAVTVKILLLTICSVLGFFVIRVPNTSTKFDKVRRGYFFDNHINIILYALILPSVFFPIIGETVVVIAATLGGPNKSILSKICPHTAVNELQPLSFPFVLASFLTAMGVSLRLLCYRTLGEYFTPEITIRPGHKLVNSGPYSIVRHPAYATVYILYMGLSLFVFHPESHFNLCGWNGSSTLLRTFSYVWACITIYILLGLMLRIPLEDENLHRHFGKEWEDYKRKVPYILIPGVY